MKNMKKYLPGFTLIELLVVIAIIGILAALVLVALGSARDKANDARIKSDVGQLRTIAEVIYDSAGSSYNDGVLSVEACFEGGAASTCGASNHASVTTLLADIDDANGASGGAATAEDSASAFCVEARLNGTTGNFVCVDSTGVTETGHTTARCTADTACAS
jgi:prepilin-type N-terminal cleavage/methylation domain-containing protein